MTITTLVVQKCDRCGDERELKDAKQGEQAGWKEVKINRHLCPNCIHFVLNEDD